MRLLDLKTFELEGPSSEVDTPFADLAPAFCMLGQVKKMSLAGKLTRGSIGRMTPAKDFAVAPASLVLGSGDSLMIASHMVALDILDISKASRLTLGEYSIGRDPFAFEALLRQTGEW